MTAPTLPLFMGQEDRQLAVRSRSAVDTRPDGDAALIRSARRGDRPAFSELYERYGRMVHGALVARVPVHDVDDLVQDVFLAALRRLNTLRDEEAFGGWLLSIARNRAVDFWKRRKIHSELPADLGQAPRPTIEVSQVLDAIRELPEAYRETLAMRLVEGMTGPEIAATTGLTPGSVRVNLHRGMKLLRESLSGKDKQ